MSTEPLALDKFHMPLVCVRSGLFLGKFYPSVGLASTTPYVQAWKETTFLHPIFSLSLSALLHRATACWQLEKSGTKQFPMQHKQLLFLAMLHASNCIKQDVAGLPSPKIVEVHFTRVIELLGWKNDQASERLQFPRLHIWKGAVKEDAENLFRNVPAWISACESVRDEWENVVRESQKKAKAQATALAMRNIRRAMYQDISLRRLWNWISTQVPQSVLENNSDLQQLFFAEESQINVWTEEDITALEDLVIQYCELGNSISHEVMRRIKELMGWWQIYYDTFEIVVDTEKFSGYKGAPEPKLADFTTKAAYLVELARWKLGNMEQKAASTTAKGSKITAEDL
jgi:hypothetical protein